MKTKNGIKVGDKVLYRDEVRTVYGVYSKKYVSLSQIDYDDVEEDYQVHINCLKKTFDYQIVDEANNWLSGGVDAPMKWIKREVEDLLVDTHKGNDIIVYYAKNLKHKQFKKR